MSAGFRGPSATKGGRRGLTEVGEGKLRHQKCPKQPPLQHVARSTCPRPRLLSCCPGTPPTMHAPWPNAPVPPSQHVWKQTQQLSHRPPSPSGFPFSERGITISVVPWARNLKVLADTCCSPIAVPNRSASPALPWKCYSVRSPSPCPGPLSGHGTELPEGPQCLPRPEAAT